MFIKFRNIAEVTTVEESMICTPDNLNRSLCFLSQALSWERQPKMLTFDCFLMLKEDSNNAQMSWSSAVEIPMEEFKAQLHFDVGCFFFYKENYSLATTHFMQSKQFCESVRNSTGFLTVDSEDLEGYIIACSGKGSQSNLLHQLRTSITNHYTASSIRNSF